MPLLACLIPRTLPNFNYYNHFTPDILNDLLHKGSTWCWTIEHWQVVDAIKEAVISSTTLSHYDPKLKKIPLSIVYDASQVTVLFR